MTGAQMLFDSHAHFDAAATDLDVGAVMGRAQAAGVGQVMAVGGSETLNRGALAVADAFPGQARAAIGFGRDLAPALTVGTRDVLAQAMAALEAQIVAHPGKVKAIGEIGLDFHYTPETADAQGVLFWAQLQLARKRGLPVVVHSRDADEVTLSNLATFAQPSEGYTGGRGVLHCFTGGERFSRALLEIGFYISFSGIVTFRNAEALRAVARRIPDDRLLIETDSPYLAPVPMRGNPNEPAYVRHVAEALAEARSCSVDEIAQLTTENARRLFAFTV